MFSNWAKTVDSLKVEADCRSDILVMRQSLRDRVGVIDDVATEEQAAKEGEDEVHSAAERNEYPDDAGHHYESDR